MGRVSNLLPRVAQTFSPTGDTDRLKSGLRSTKLRIEFGQAFRDYAERKYVKSSFWLRVGIAITCFLAVAIVWRAWRPSSDPDSVKALGRKAAMCDPKSVAELKALGPKAVPSLVELLEFQDSHWRRVAWVLAPKLPRRLAQALLSKAGALGASEVRAAGAKSLGVLGPQAEAALPNLLRALHDSEPYVAMEAGGALGRIGKPSIPGLTLALTDTNRFVRHAAVYALGEMGMEAEPAVPELIETLQDPDSTVRSSTDYSLSLIGFPTLLALSNVIDHADPGARAEAVKEFIRFYRSVRLMAPALNKMAHAADAGSRALALQTLGSVRATDNVTINTLIASLKDPVEEVRVAGLRALSQVAWRAQPAVSALKGCLKDPSSAVRLWAVNALGAIGPVAGEASGELSGLMTDSEPGVRVAAQKALARIQPHEPARN